MSDSSNLGKIIIINGPSSAGKTTLALALQNKIDVPFLRFSFDVFMENNVLPMERIKNSTLSWQSMRPCVFDGFHQCLPALAAAGNNLIVDHIIETKAWMNDLIELLSAYDVYFVGLHCSLPELERRELQRGNRRPGEARTDFETIHSFASYDLELSSEDSLDGNVATLIAAWNNRRKPTAFDKMAKKMDVKL